MRIAIVHALAVLTASMALGDLAHAQGHRPSAPADYAALVRAKLPTGWRCTHDFETVVITRDEDVVLLPRLGMPAGSRESLIRDFGVRSPYLIVLTFTPRLSDTEYARVIAQRDAAVADVRARYADPRLGKDLYGVEAMELAKHRIPQYRNEAFRIYLHATTDEPSRSELRGNLYLAAPDTAIDERDGVMRTLLENLTPYPALPTDRKPY